MSDTAKPPLTREEWNDQINQYESQIERLNELLDEIQEMVSPYSSDRIDPDWIQYVLDKRPVKP
jgi:hypothetical protein